MIRVDYETRDPIPAMVEARLHAELPAALEWADVVLISDYGKGVCTPSLLRAIIDAGRSSGVKVLADPIRSSDYGRYHGVHCMTPNRLEAQLATGLTIATPEDALRVGRKLVETLGMEAVLVTLDRDGMALVRADGRAELLPTRPRQVYDITGAGDMVLAVVGLCIASGADYDEAAALGNIAGGLEVEKFGVALLNREEILRDLVDHHHPEDSKILDRKHLLAEVHRRRLAGQTVVFTNGCFDLLHPGHVRLLREAANLGDFLVVGLNSDASVRRLKGPSRPINPAEARAEVLSALEAVDAVTIFDEDTPLELITAIRPDVLVKGGDYRPDQVVGRAEVEEAGGRLVLIPLAEGHSTTHPGPPRLRAGGSLPTPPNQPLAPHVGRVSAGDAGHDRPQGRSADPATASRLSRLRALLRQLAEELECFVELANRRAANPAATVQLVEEHQVVVILGCLDPRSRLHAERARAESLDLHVVGDQPLGARGDRTFQ